jgi:hypothetical protein
MNRLYLNFLIVLCLTACGAADVSAQEQKAGEYQVKALFIYNFINFVDWPAGSSFDSSPTVNVCVIGEDPFGEALNDIRSETVKGKRLAIRFYRSYDEPEGCHLLFIPASEKNHMGRILRSISDKSVLTVADTEESVRQGAVIGFFIEQKRVRFAVNLEAARRAGLKISAKLLKLAKIIKSTEN